MYRVIGDAVLPKGSSAAMFTSFNGDGILECIVGSSPALLATAFGLDFLHLAIPALAFTDWVVTSPGMTPSRLTGSGKFGVVGVIGSLFCAGR